MWLITHTISKFRGKLAHNLVVFTNFVTTPASEDTPGTPEHARPDTVCHIRNWNEVCANNTITPSPHPTSSDLADKSQDGEDNEAQVTENDASNIPSGLGDKSQDGEDDEVQVTENDASNIPIDELKVFVKGKRCKLDFSNCSIELIDELFPKKNTFGTMDPRLQADHLQ